VAFPLSRDIKRMARGGTSIQTAKALEVQIASTQKKQKTGLRKRDCGKATKVYGGRMYGEVNRMLDVRRTEST